MGGGGRGKATNRRPEELEDDEAFALIFPTLPVTHFAPPMPPLSWSQGVKPKGPAALPDLDAVIEAIIKKKQPGAVKCPYYTARWWILLAVRLGRDAISDEDGLRNRIDGKKARMDLAKRTLKAAELLRDILEQESPSIEDERNVIPKNARGFDQPDYDAENLARAQLFELIANIRTAVPALTELAGMMDAAERETLKPMSADASPWLNGFVETLGYWWTEIWGEMPARTGDSPFAKFAAAAYATLGGDTDELTTQKVRTIVARVRGGDGHKARRRDDQFDRYESLLAPQRERRKAIGEDLWREEIAAAQAAFWARDKARVGAHQAFLKDAFDEAKTTSEWALMHRLYTTVSANDRAFLEKLGYKPPKSD